MNDKTAYVQEVEGQLESWSNDIYKFKIIAEDAGWQNPDRQIKYYQIIEHITDQTNEIADKLSALKETENDWHADAVKIDALRKDVADNISSAYSTVT